jgi:hypothetical protein
MKHLAVTALQLQARKELSVARDETRFAWIGRPFVGRLLPSRISLLGSSK